MEDRIWDGAHGARLRLLVAGDQRVPNGLMALPHPSNKKRAVVVDGPLVGWLAPSPSVDSVVGKSGAQSRIRILPQVGEKVRTVAPDSRNHDISRQSSKPCVAHSAVLLLVRRRTRPPDRAAS